MSAMLEIRNLSKGFTLHAADRRVRGCEDVSLVVEQGEVVGITGRSGSGKSTILKCLYRTNLPESGSILYDSEAFGMVDLATLDERRVIYLRNYEIGYVSQFLDVVPRTTARQIVAASAAEAFADERDVESETTRMLEHFDFPRPRIKLEADPRLVSTMPSRLTTTPIPHRASSAAL